MAINFAGYVFDDSGSAVSGATVQLLETGTSTEEASTTTNSSGLWSFSEADQDRYDIKVTSGASVRYRNWDDQIQLKEIDIRNPTGNTTPALTVTNLTNNAANQVAVFSGANSTRADNDEIYISFKLADSAGNIDEFARMTAVATDVTSGSEDGQIEFDVMKAGTLTKVWTITSSTGAAMSFDVNVDALTIGSGADTDVSLTFDANSNDGVITWMEDEDHFKFSDEIFMNSTEKIEFGDTGTFIHQSSDGVLTIESDTTVDINGAVALNGAITGATDITLTGELDAATLDLSSSADIAGDLVLSGGADGALQFTNAGENSIKIPDNQASALIIEEANNAYITFVTTDSSEAITVAKATTFSAGIADSGTIAAGTWNGTAIASSYIAADAITGAKIADDAIDSEHYTDGSIDTAHLAADAVTGAKIADDALDSEHYTDGSIDTAHLANDAVTNAKIADDALDSEHYTDGSIDTAHIADNQVTLAKMAGLARGKIIYGDASGDPAALAVGTAGYALATDGTDLAYTNSLLADDYVIGEDAQTKIDFETANEIHFDADNAQIVNITSEGVAVADSKFMEFESAAGTPATDDKAQGIVIEFLAAEAITQWDAVYVSSTTGRVGRANSTAAGTMPAIGVAIEAQGSAGSSVRVLTHGVYRDDGGFGGNLTPGAEVYAPESDGNLTATRPSDDGDFVQVMGVAVGVRSVFINPSLTLVEHA